MITQKQMRRKHRKIKEVSYRVWVRASLQMILGKYSPKLDQILKGKTQWKYMIEKAKK